MDRQRKIANLRAALGLALKYLERYEPPDSRAVSNEFVAMASVAADCENDECMQIIHAASTLELPPVPQPEISVTFD